MPSVATRLFFFGTPRVELDGQAVALPAKAVALLAYLAATGTSQSRDRVLGLLWGESAEDAARKNLRNTLWTIRKALGEAAVVTDNDRLALGTAVWADVRAFSVGDSTTNPQHQLVHYAGAFLDGLSLYDAPEYELWVAAERERLAQVYLRVAAAVIEAQAAAGEWREVLTIARGALAHDNLHEPFYRALMTGHARLGERGEALRQYDTLKAILARELGVEPLPETEALRESVLRSDEWGVSWSMERIAPPPAASQAAPPGSAPPPFIGRVRERALLDEALAAALPGQTRVALITGELGIGKSRLWREWSAGLPAGCTVLAARCLEATQSLPFAPLTELFAGHMCTQRLLQLGSPLPAGWLAEVARLLPAVRAAIPHLPAPAALPPDEERRRVFEAFVQVLLALEVRPLIVFIDDVHWADRTTLDWLAYLVHRLREQALLLVLAYRPEDASPVLVHQAAAWGREGVAHRLPLARLTSEESAALIAALHVAPAQTHTLQDQSAGNPYFLVELSRAAAGEFDAPVPPVLADLVRARLERLPGSARQVLQAAAILEPDFDLFTLRRTSGRSEEETLDALDALLAAGVFAERGRDYAFTHPLVAAVVREGLSGARCAFLHRRAAEVLESAHAGRLAPLASRLATHAAYAGDLNKAAGFADLAAQHALSLAAPAEAAGFYRQALALVPTLARRLGLGNALYRMDDLAGARAAYESTLAEAEVVGDRRSAARASLGMADTYLPAGRPDLVVRWAAHGLDFLDATADPAAHAHAHFLFGAGRLRAGGPALVEAERHLAEAAHLAQTHGLKDVATVSRFELGNLLAERGNLAGAIAIYEEVAALAQAVGDVNQQVLAQNNAAYHALLASDLPAAHRHIAVALAVADDSGLRVARQYLFSTRGEIALAEGQWDIAEIWFRRSLAEAESYDNPEQIAKCRANLALVARGRGAFLADPGPALDSALILLDEAAALAAPLTARFMQTQIDLWLTEVYLARGERAAAAEALARGEARLAGGQYERLVNWAATLRSQLAKGGRR